MTLRSYGNLPPIAVLDEKLNNDNSVAVCFPFERTITSVTFRGCSGNAVLDYMRPHQELSEPGISLPIGYQTLTRVQSTKERSPTMSLAWTSSIASTNALTDTQRTQRTAAAFIVLGGVIFNWVLCFVNTTVFGIGSNIVIGAEMALIGTALGLVWYRGYAFYAILLCLTTYFFALMLIRSEFDAKILRDLLIPIAFFFLGRYLGSLKSADRLVTFLIFLALGVAVFEWMALNSYLHYFDVIHYYQARGTEQTLEADTAGGLFIKGADSSAGLYINGTRFGERALLSFLGEHRVSGIFLEPVSVGNFAAIAFSWVLLRDRSRIWLLVAQMLAIATILLLADDRFGVYLCLFTVTAYVIAPVIRPTMLFLAPALIGIALSTYGYVNWAEQWDNTMSGRLLFAGQSLATLSPLQVLGLQLSDVFASGYSGDSGYGYVLVKVGLIGIAAVWALFVYAPVFDIDTWRFKVFIACYTAFLLIISTSLFSIKTAALLWFLYGTLHNRTNPAAALDAT
jgi:putative polymerase